VVVVVVVAAAAVSGGGGDRYGGGGGGGHWTDLFARLSVADRLRKVSSPFLFSPLTFLRLRFAPQPTYLPIALPSWLLRALLLVEN